MSSSQMHKVLPPNQHVTKVGPGPSEKYDFSVREDPVQQLKRLSNAARTSNSMPRMSAGGPPVRMNKFGKPMKTISWQDPIDEIIPTYTYYPEVPGEYEPIPGYDDFGGDQQSGIPSFDDEEDEFSQESQQSCEFEKAFGDDEIQQEIAASSNRLSLLGDSSRPHPNVVPDSPSSVEKACVQSLAAPVSTLVDDDLDMPSAKKTPLKMNNLAVVSSPSMSPPVPVNLAQQLHGQHHKSPVNVAKPLTPILGSAPLMPPSGDIHRGEVNRSVQKYPQFKSPGSSAFSRVVIDKVTPGKSKNKPFGPNSAQKFVEQPKIPEEKVEELPRRKSAGRRSSVDGSAFVPDAMAMTTPMFAPNQGAPSSSMALGPMEELNLGATDEDPPASRPASSRLSCEDGLEPMSEKGERRRKKLANGKMMKASTTPLFPEEKKPQSKIIVGGGGIFDQKPGQSLEKIEEVRAGFEKEPEGPLFAASVGDFPPSPKQAQKLAVVDSAVSLSLPESVCLRESLSKPADASTTTTTIFAPRKSIDGSRVSMVKPPTLSSGDLVVENVDEPRRLSTAAPFSNNSPQQVQAQRLSMGQQSNPRLSMAAPLPGPSPHSSDGRQSLTRHSTGSTGRPSAAASERRKSVFDALGDPTAMVPPRMSVASNRNESPAPRMSTVSNPPMKTSPEQPKPRMSVASRPSMPPRQSMASRASVGSEKRKSLFSMLGSPGAEVPDVTKAAAVPLPDDDEDQEENFIVGYKPPPKRPLEQEDNFVVGFKPPPKAPAPSPEVSAVRLSQISEKNPTPKPPSFAS